MIVGLAISAKKIQNIGSQLLLVPPSNSFRMRAMRLVNDSPNFPRSLNREYTSFPIVIVFRLFNEHSYLGK